MKKLLFIALVTPFLFISCKKESNDFLISSNAVGKITPQTKIKQLDSIFTNDSIVKTQSSPNAIETQGDVEVYEKGGKRLLLISPKTDLDPNAYISDIIVYDARFHTENGLNSNSKFKDFKDNYEIAGIERILNGALVFLKDSDIYLTIDGKHLTPEVRTDRSVKIEAQHIFDDAPIKYLRVDWDSKN